MIENTQIPENESSDVQLDVTGFQCPMPLLKLKLALNKMDIGQTITIIVSDRTALKDIPAFCDLAGHHLLRVREEAALVIFIIRKG